MQHLDLINERDEVFGKESVDRIHKDNLLHRAVEVFIVTSNGRILLKKNDNLQERYPDKWCGSVSRHVLIDKTPLQAAEKGVEEEIGVELPLKFITKFLIHTDYEYELVSVFLGTFVGPYDFDEKGFSDFRFFSKEELLNKINGLDLAPQTRKALLVLLKDHDW